MGGTGGQGACNHRLPNPQPPPPLSLASVASPTRTTPPASSSHVSSLSLQRAAAAARAARAGVSAGEPSGGPPGLARTSPSGAKLVPVTSRTTGLGGAEDDAGGARTRAHTAIWFVVSVPAHGWCGSGARGGGRVGVKAAGLDTCWARPTRPALASSPANHQPPTHTPSLARFVRTDDSGAAERLHCRQGAHDGVAPRHLKSRGGPGGEEA